MERFKRQYLLVAEKITSEPFSDWTFFEVGSHFLYVHPDIDVYAHTSNAGYAILIGFAFHIENQALNEDHFVRELPTGEDEMLDFIDNYAGNYVLFLERDEVFTIYNDPAAAFKAFYYKPADQILGVAPDPNLLAHVFNQDVTKDVEALRFYESETFKHHKIWMGELTYFDDIKQLIANHRLIVHEAKAERYFPRKPIDKLTVEESITRVRGYFDTIIPAVFKRYKVICALTGGWDSRILLSALKGRTKDVFFYTFRRAGRSVKDQDFTTPNKMASTLGLDYKTIDFEPEFPEDENLKASYAHYGWKRFNHIQQGFKSFSFKEHMALLGTVSEVCKNYYDNVPITDGKTFAQAAHYPLVPYVLDWFQQRYDEIKPLEKYGIDLKDLGHWEQDITNFAAQDALHSMSHIHTFPPFNNRKVICAVLAVPRELRDKQDHKYYHAYLDAVWPELNQFPINNTRKKRLIVLSKRLGLYDFYKNLSTRIRK